MNGRKRLTDGASLIRPTLLWPTECHRNAADNNCPTFRHGWSCKPHHYNSSDKKNFCLHLILPFKSYIKKYSSN